MENAATPPPNLRKRDVNGWLVFDKPIGMTSTHAVAHVKRLFCAKKAGHAGTLDPLASGCLPIAFGEATKTVPFVMDGRKAYRFTVTWGVETDTDDAEGRPVTTSPKRPTRDEVEAEIPAFIGQIQQQPPRYSAIKIAGERAYDLAREGETVELQPRAVEVFSLVVATHDEQTTVLEAICGKGTYVRAIARDLGRKLGCLGHVSQLRRTLVGPFREAEMVTVADLDRLTEGDEPLARLNGVLAPVSAALSELAEIQVGKSDAGRLMRGQSVLIRGRDAPLGSSVVSVTCLGRLIAIGAVEKGEITPRRVFHLD